MTRTTTKAGLFVGVLIALSLFGVATASADSRPTGDEQNTPPVAAVAMGSHGCSGSILDYHGPQV
jgi:hypothetical protein